MQSAGDLPYLSAFLLFEESGASPMEYVLAVSILMVLGGLMLLAMSKPW